MSYTAWAGAVIVALGSMGCDGRDAGMTAPSAALPPAAPLPADSRVMNGTVTDSAFRRLGGAHIEILDGPLAGRTTIADALGHFMFAGPFDEQTRFRASLEGHVPSTRTLNPFCAPCSPNWWISFRLEPVVRSVQIAGDYSMTFVADPACSNLPSELRSRTFSASIPQPTNETAENATFRMRGATFFEDWDAVGVGVAGDYVSFVLETLVEQPAPNSFFAFGGEASGSIDANSLASFTLPFKGVIEACVTRAASGRYQDCYQGREASRSVCEGSHQLVVTRR